MSWKDHRKCPLFWYKNNNDNNDDDDDDDDGLNHINKVSIQNMVLHLLVTDKSD